MLGKTTTLKLFTDLIRPSAGEALINGVNVHTDKKRALDSVSALIEIPEIYPALTPREALMMIAEIRGVPRSERNKRIEEAVSDVMVLLRGSSGLHILLQFDVQKQLYVYHSHHNSLPFCIRYSSAFRC